MTTPLYSTFQKRINDATDQLIQRQVTPWVFLSAGPRFRVKRFDGREITYAGIRFEGSPQKVFWSRYIDPFLESMAIEEIAVSVTLARERDIDARLLLPEVQGLLIAAAKRTFFQMAEVERRLLGRGDPESISLRSIERELQQIIEFIEERVRCEIVMWRPKPKLEEWYERNKSWVWLIGTVITVVGLVAKFSNPT